MIVSTNCAASSSIPKISFSVFQPVQGILIPNSECLQLYDACLIMFPNQRQCGVTTHIAFKKRKVNTNNIDHKKKRFLLQQKMFFCAPFCVFLWSMFCFFLWFFLCFFLCSMVCSIFKENTLLAEKTSSQNNSLSKMQLFFCAFVCGFFGAFLQKGNTYQTTKKTTNKSKKKKKP